MAAIEQKGRLASDWSDEQVETVVGNILRAGVMLAGGVVLLGGIAYLAVHGHERPDVHVFKGVPPELRSVRGIIGDALALHPRGIVQLGLLLLIATPVARVVLAAYAFHRQRDRVFVAVALFVLLVLLGSLAGWRL